MTSNTNDELPSVYDGLTLKWSSSNENLYLISDEIGKTNQLNQTHKKQTVTVSLEVTGENFVETFSKEIIINPVLFDEMVNPAAIYFAVSSIGNYENNNANYIKNGEYFSEKVKENLDMVYYSFAIPQSDGTLTLDTKYLDKVMALKNYGVRVLLVIDGANSAPLKAMVELCNVDATRKKFVDNIMNLVKIYNFDGVDIDWEFPGTSGLDGFTTAIDQVNLNKLLRDLRREFTDYQDEGGSPYILSVAIPSSSWGSARYKFVGDETLGGINDYCDYVNMMSYDLNNPEFTTHLSSCYSSKVSNDFKFGCVYGAERFIELGLDKSKIILGAAAYGKAYKVTADVDMNVTNPALGMSGELTKINGVTGSYASGTIYYNGIIELIESGNYTKYTEYNNGKIVGSYLYSLKDDIFITYDSIEAVTEKCVYAKENGYGVMVWSYGEDSSETIINTICDKLK